MSLAQTRLTPTPMAMGYQTIATPTTMAMALTRLQSVEVALSLWIPTVMGCRTVLIRTMITTVSAATA